MPPAPDHSAELALFWGVLLNVAVFGAAFRWAARRLTACRSQAMLDAALIGYAVQYVAVAGPGVVGLLRPASVATVAVAASAAVWAAAGRRRRTSPAANPDRAVVIALGTFAAAILVGWSVVQADLPVMSDDALTYHFPAAVQWLQHGRIELFPTWFFNPANGYSPLAGSTFIAWLIVPFSSDVLARYVQVPMLLCVALAAYRLARQLAAAPAAAVAVAAAVVLCRPLLLASQMGKDDLFVALTCVAALVALDRVRADEPFGPARLGLAVGLLLATKYTAALSLPLVLLAVDGPRWRPRSWLTAAAVAAVVAGPWYARNWIATGNPLFPLAVPHLFRGLFTTARSGALASVVADAKTVIGGSYGVPTAVAVVIATGWTATVVRHRRRAWNDPLLRACLVGPPIVAALFFWRSPFPEPRFLFPGLVLTMAAVAVAVPARLRWAVLALPAATVATLSVSSGWQVLTPVVTVAAGLAVAATVTDRLASTPRRRVAVVAVTVLLPVAAAYVWWQAYCDEYAGVWAGDGTGWTVAHGDESPLWLAVNRLVPADATVAYTDLYRVYPLLGPTLRRRVTYVPTRSGIRTPADLPYLGDGLADRYLIAAADAATTADPDPAVWRANLRRSAAGYLVVGHAVPGTTPVEQRWADADPEHFRPLYAGVAGRVYVIGRDP